ncbi:hypothetical protein DPMN_177010 [Dreissena polymorpha]|uniref:Uncharacterized protein n=1 Tax=Dreissena polymorpha TaxID=45954 RepID=A0A9D4EAX8_DREPO|nr:hypothetical protein DPMN_177010 [Dreissena polymorpha]
MKERMVTMEPPTSAKTEEKCGTERATNRTAPITTVRVKIRFHNISYRNSLKRTAQTQIRRRIMRRLIWVYDVNSIKPDQAVGYWSGSVGMSDRGRSGRDDRAEIEKMVEWTS